MIRSEHVCSCGARFERTTFVSGLKRPDQCGRCWSGVKTLPAIPTTQEVYVTIIEDDDQTPEGEVEALTTEVQESLTMVREFPVECQADLDMAQEILKDVKTRVKALEKLKKTITGPMNEALNAARAMFRPAESALASIEYEIKSKVKQYNNAQELRAREAAQALQKAATSAQASSALAERASAEVKAPKGMTLTKVWKFEVETPSIVPREYLMVDESAIRRAVAAGVRDIPGVTIYEDTQVAVRTK